MKQDSGQTRLDDLNDLALFAKVVEHQGFTAASLRIGVPKASLSRRIAQLEERLGARLLQRTSRRLAVTPVGRAFYERCQAMLAMAESAHDVVREAVSTPKGPLRVTCPITLAQVWLTPLLPAFLAANPDVRLSVVTTNRRIDPVEDNVDIALRVRRPPFEDSGLVVRPIGRTEDILVAAPPALARGGPASPEDLPRWPLLALPSPDGRAHWRLRSGDTVQDLQAPAAFACDDMFALHHAALGGAGIALLPAMVCSGALASGALVRVLPAWASEAGEVQAAFPTRRGMLPAVRAFIDHVSAKPPPA